MVQKKGLFLWEYFKRETSKDSKRKEGWEGRREGKRGNYFGAFLGGYRCWGEETWGLLEGGCRLSTWVSFRDEDVPNTLAFAS